MIVFLTSSPTGDLDGRFRVDGIDNRNAFCDELRKVWKENSRCLLLTATPTIHARSEEFAGFLWNALNQSNLTTLQVDILDDRHMEISQEEINGYDCIIMGGGHVPTQNSFIQALGFKEKMQGYDGIVIGISAGSMNCAELVYAQPEEAGEAIDPSYQRFLPGLGLTNINVLPHYQMLKGTSLDGLKLFEEITMPDSQGKTFIALPDGSYIMIRDQEVKICGPALRIYPDHMEEIEKETLSSEEGEK